MEKKRSKGVAFWGYLILFAGIGYGIINSARNIWRLGYVGTPILLVAVGIGILCLKNWARWTFLIFSMLLFLTGIINLPVFMQSIHNLYNEGLFLPAVIAFSARFIIAICGIIFFLQSSVKEQFEGGKL